LGSRKDLPLDKHVKPVDEPRSRVGELRSEPVEPVDAVLDDVTIRVDDRSELAGEFGHQRLPAMKRMEHYLL
jgi:hypothetical protein